MTQERLKEIADDAADALTTPSQVSLLQIVSCVPDLLAHISTLESELRQVRVERDGLREALDVDPFCYDVAGDEFCYWCRRERPRLGVYEMRDYQKPEHHDADCQFAAALSPAPAARTEEI